MLIVSLWLTTAGIGAGTAGAILIAAGFIRLIIIGTLLGILAAGAVFVIKSFTIISARLIGQSAAGIGAGTAGTKCVSAGQICFAVIGT
ncbi:MAG: hypothetical protein AABY41_08020, partial [Nitrospirota bacterium]